ncbi:hypothetical protein V5O48_015736 [Marasmius crinis-equi]|uniref:Zn(2)-C6 fungal-type domain-containing protein n=1 Tax=Marasmius crinis-equi TaxID=585013 RepID=A0ABR3ETP7_9AGAR
MDADGDTDPDSSQLPPIATLEDDAGAGASCSGVESTLLKAEASNVRDEISSLADAEGDTDPDCTLESLRSDELDETFSVNVENGKGKEKLAACSSVDDLSDERKSEIVKSFRVYGTSQRRRQETIHAEKAWAEEQTGKIGNCTNCKTTAGCVFERERARCVRCVKGKIRCSHLDAFKYEWLAKAYNVTPEVVQEIVGLFPEIRGSRVSNTGVELQNTSESSKKPSKSRRKVGKEAGGAKGKRTSSRRATTRTTLENRPSTAGPSTGDSPEEIINRIEGAEFTETEDGPRLDRDCDMKDVPIRSSTTSPLFTDDSHDSDPQISVQAPRMREKTSSELYESEAVDPENPNPTLHVDSQTAQQNEGAAELETNNALRLILHTEPPVSGDDSHRDLRNEDKTFPSTADASAPLDTREGDPQAPVADVRDDYSPTAMEDVPAMPIACEKDHVDEGNLRGRSECNDTEQIVDTSLPSLPSAQESAGPCPDDDEEDMMISPDVSMTEGVITDGADSMNVDQSQPTLPEHEPEEPMKGIVGSTSISVTKDSNEDVIQPHGAPMEADDTMDEEPPASVHDSLNSEKINGEDSDVHANPGLQAWVYIVKAEAALRNGYQEEAESYLKDVLDNCEVVFH